MKSVKIIDKMGLFEWWVREDFPKLKQVMDNPSFDNMYSSGMQKYLHNEDGPAVRHTNPEKNFYEYYLNGEKIGNGNSSDEENELLYKNKLKELQEKANEN